VTETAEDRNRLLLIGGISGHVGDGNFYVAPWWARPMQMR